MKRLFTIAVPVVVLASLIAWRVGERRAETAGQAAMKAARMNAPAVVAMAPVQVRDIVRVFEATGSLQAPLDVKIAPKITGRIDYLEVREGDRVSKGQVLVKIDSSDVEAQVQEQMAALAEAQYRLAQAQINQAPTDVAVNTQITQQKAAVTSADADYNQAKKTYDAQLAAANASVTDAQSKVDNANASVKSAQANLDNAQARYDRVKGLFDKGFVAAQALDDAKAAVAVQQAALEVAQGQVKSAMAVRDAAQQQLKVVKAKGEADIEAAHAKLVQSQASLEYAKANTSQKSAYRQSIAALKASVAAAQAALDSAKAKRRDTVLVSPLDGYVTGRYSDPGAIASPTQPIISVQFMKQVWVTVPVPEEVCAKLHIGDPGTVRLDAIPDRTFEASIIQINPAADPESRQFTVRLIMSNGSGELKPGMYAKVAFATERIAGATVVPREAILRDREGAYVVTPGNENKAEQVRVSPGAEDEDYVSIGDALAPGRKVVTMSTMPVREGQMIVGGAPGGGEGRKGEGGRQ